MRMVGTPQRNTTRHSIAQHLSDWTEIERGERREGWRFEAKEAKEVEDVQEGHGIKLSSRQSDRMEIACM